MLIFFKFSFFLGGIVPLFLGAFIYLQNKKEIVNKTYFGLSLCNAIWSLGFWALLSSDTIEMAYFWRWFMESGSILIPAFWFHFVYAFLNLHKEKRTEIIFVYLVSSFLWLLNFADLFVKGLFAKELIKQYIFDFYPKAGIGYILFFLFFFLIILYSLLELLKNYKKSDTLKARQISYLITAAFLGFAGGGTTFFFTLNIPIAPYGVMLFSLYPIIMAYAITKHHLFDVRVITVELLTFGIWILILIRTLLANTTQEKLLNGGLFILLVVFGILLIENVIKEIKNKEQIETLNSQLNKSMNELRKIDELKTEFVSLASHQLRTPLTPIKGFSDMLLEGSVGSGVVADLEQRNAIKMINESANRMDNLIDDILDVSKLEKEGGFTYAFQLANPEEVIKKVVDDFTKQAKDKGLELSFTSTLLPTTEVKLDLVKFTDAIGNLLSNSVKYTLKGNIQVTIGEKEGNVVISVKDTGVGIEKEDMPRLFQKFFRGKEMARLDAMGTGLGLYFTRHVIEDHGGRITVQSEGPQKGSEFIVRLPKVVSGPTP